MLDGGQLEDCVTRFSRESGLVAVWLFGSAAADRLRADSDIDFALYFSPGTEPSLGGLGRLAMDLESILGRKVDLGCLDSRNLVYAVQAFQSGRLVYAKNESEAVALVSHLQTLYVDLKEDRKVVEEAYCA